MISALNQLGGMYYTVLMQAVQGDIVDNPSGFYIKLLHRPSTPGRRSEFHLPQAKKSKSQALLSMLKIKYGLCILECHGSQG